MSLCVSTIGLRLCLVAFPILSCVCVCVLVLSLNLLCIPLLVVAKYSNEGRHRTLPPSLSRSLSSPSLLHYYIYVLQHPSFSPASSVLVCVCVCVYDCPSHTSPHTFHQPPSHPLMHVCVHVPVSLFFSPPLLLTAPKTRAKAVWVVT